MHKTNKDEIASHDVLDVWHWLAQQKQTLPTPLYLYDEKMLEASVMAYRSLFPRDTQGFYALKANPQPMLVRKFAACGLGAEIAGEGEWELCAAAEVPPSTILVGGVTKSEAFLRRVCREGHAAIVIESEGEWSRLKTAVSDSNQAKILLRINPGVSFGGLNMAGGSQFGLSVEQALAIARECASHPTITFLGLHFYFGSQRLEVEPILKAVAMVMEIITTMQQADVNIAVVDLGLGCGVPYLARDKALDYKALQTALHALWQQPVWDDVEIWFEAGRALVAASGYFVARVVDNKLLHDERFIFLDGGLNVHNPGVGLGRFFRRNPAFCFVTDNAADEVASINIVGNLCTTADTLGTAVTAPQLNTGDFVVIPNAGAYCATTAFWGFNSQPLFHEGMLGQDSQFTLWKPQFEFRLA